LGADVVVRVRELVLGVLRFDMRECSHASTNEANFRSVRAVKACASARWGIDLSCAKCDGSGVKLWFALIAIAACSGSAREPNVPTGASGRAQRFTIGSLDAYALEDGYLVAPNDGKLLDFGRAPSDVGDVLAAAGLPHDTIRLDINCLLVKTHDHVLLFDTGAGDEPWAKAGHLAQSLALAHVLPTDVTDIFISHAHSDHVGGLLARSGTLAFPSAAIHMSVPEWTALQADTDDNGKRLVAAIASQVAPFEPGAQLLPDVKAVATQGHTQGHSSYEIGTGENKLFYTGDLVHHSIISLQHPDWIPSVDGDHDAARAMRQQTLASLAATHERVFVGHFPFPGVGHVEAHESAFRWVAN
jgi:glyoxylase-like metal-dependent hydrolase (beta-lactamase superfamily II)